MLLEPGPQCCGTEEHAQSAEQMAAAGPRVSARSATIVGTPAEMKIDGVLRNPFRAP